MARRNRAEVVVADEVGVYHCVQRVVRRAFLCGVDPLSDKSYDHRRSWIRDRLESLAGFFGVEIAAFAVMSNHLHVILRNRPDVGHPLVRSGGRPAVAGRLPGPRGEQAGSHLRPGCLSWANGRTGIIEIASHPGQATGSGTDRPPGAGGRDADSGTRR